MAKERNIRVTGKRRPFEVGRFVLAVMVQAEGLAEQQQAEQQQEQDEGQAGDGSSSAQVDDGVLWDRSSENAQSSEQEAA